MSSITDDLCQAFLDDGHALFRGACARFAREEIAPHAFAWEEAEAFDPALYRKAGEAGLLGPSLPAEVGGGGGDVFHVLVSTEALMRSGCTGAVVGLGSLEIAVPPILVLGSEEQRGRLVPPVLRGERVAALAITEPGAGSDVAGVRLTAERRGDHYVLNGEKRFVTSGVRADLVVTLARTGPDPHGGLTFFAVERPTDGLTVSRALKKTGWRASDTAELRFEDVRVPVEARLGDEGSGFVCLMKTFQHERLYLAAQGYAIAEVCLEEAVAYARQREAFGRPIARMQAIRHKLADMAAKVLAAKALTYQVAARLRAGTSRPAEVAAAKNVAADAARDVSWEAVQVFGGMGYMRETLVERLSRDARLLAIGGGTSEVMRELVARELLAD
ncbi:MAG: acyl-CoA dehydrogenase family protein [Planctomycetes bacterium]|nr:acyl-CoA dehydrogenase family protein [Planctomycetota bacterium]